MCCRADHPSNTRPWHSRILLSLCVALAPVATISLAVAADTGGAQGRTDDLENHRAIAARQIKTYNDTFPGIRFVQLAGGDRWHREMIDFASMLDHEAEPIDYQHPKDLRPALMQVTLQRLVIMLRSSQISATTFQVPPDNPFGRSFVCVVTLDSDHVASTEFDITRVFLGADAATMRRVHSARHLDHEDYLAFALDHEVFHCLNSVRYGGAPRTSEKLRADYVQFQRESAADAYALAMHIRSHGAVTPFARNVFQIRTLQLFLGDPHRATFETLRELLTIDPRRLSAMPVSELVALTHGMAMRAVGPYETYLDHRAAAYHATRALGLQSTLDPEVNKQLLRHPVDPALVARLVSRYHYYYRNLFTDAQIAFDPPESVQR